MKDVDFGGKKLLHERLSACAGDTNEDEIESSSDGLFLV